MMMMIHCREPLMYLGFVVLWKIYSSFCQVTRGAAGVTGAPHKGFWHSQIQPHSCWFPTHLGQQVCYFYCASGEVRASHSVPCCFMASAMFMDKIVCEVFICWCLVTCLVFYLPRTVSWCLFAVNAVKILRYIIVSAWEWVIAAFFFSVIIDFSLIFFHFLKISLT